MFLPKIFSKRGQVSTEVAILIIATITVSTIAAYYYITNYLNSSPDIPGKTANKTLKILNKISKNYSNKFLKSMNS